DTLLIFLATLSLYYLLRIIRHDATRANAVLLGITLGALLVTKVSALFIVIPVGVVLLFSRHARRYTLWLVSLVLVVAGWWYILNFIRDGDITNTRALLETWSAESIRSGTIALDMAWQRIPFAYATVWARFGQGAVSVYSSIYLLFDMLIILVVSGLILRPFVRRIKKQPLPFDYPPLISTTVIVTFVGTWFFALIYWSATAWSGNQGRYLLPGIAAWATIGAYGLSAWIPPCCAAIMNRITIGILALGAAITLFGAFLPAYQPLNVPPEIAVPLAYRFGDIAELMGMSPARITARPGDEVEIKLYWRALRATNREFQVYLNSVENNTIRRNSYPGNGNLLSTDWETGQTWTEQFLITIPSDTVPQTTLSLVAGLYDASSQTALVAQDNQGNDVTPFV
ncbi:MAG: hypothetical protein KC496_11950, partial [Anaerolineae bacterium]|nr:hypothetical protein [Anaerolineae bacterium]